LIQEGKIVARTKWKDVYPNLAKDERYLSLLGNPGSNPLELFWDVVDSLDKSLDQKIADVEQAITRYNTNHAVENEESDQATAAPPAFVIGFDTNLDEFIKLVKADGSESVKNLTDEDLQDVFKTVRGQSCDTCHTDVLVSASRSSAQKASR
jgi:pre-mRNA-processing factor 40